MSSAHEKMQSQNMYGTCNSEQSFVILWVSSRTGCPWLVDARISAAEKDTPVLVNA